MKMALVGYGKMGQAIERIALSRGHEVVLRITSQNQAILNQYTGPVPEVAIEFTAPAVAPAMVTKCLALGWAVVTGTTGWNAALEGLKQQVKTQGGALLHASNFSVGMNIFFEANKLLARLMAQQQSYATSIEETHHIHKKDAPSGTAVTLAEQIIAEQNQFTGWELGQGSDTNKLPIMAIRTDEVPGTHIVRFSSGIDTIELTHIAHNRDGFALGAVMAAEFLAGKHGLYTMQDVLGLTRMNH
ncbi:MAG: 4-hydroxy-tetrahydrodipicolinate reductase [Chitinophagia bacterium]|nr:4-hydroxy-tetrahydrodipicolinate reductase [Chitinophagia bacterium]